jgi:hypothetical protein
MSAGGTLIEDQHSGENLINLWGGSHEVLRIISMRAKATKHVPTPDGVLLACPPEPRFAQGQEPIHISFDFRSVNLKHTDSVPALRESNAVSHVKQFEDGYSIVLAKNESVQLAVTTHQSVDSVDWHIEVVAVVGGRIETLTINQVAKRFHTPGLRQFDDYQEGHSGVEPQWDNGPARDWGIEQDAARVDDGAYGQVLRWHDVVIPFVKGLDVYVPYRNQYRAIRHNGYKLISFNPPDVAPQEY